MIESGVPLTARCALALDVAAVRTPLSSNGVACVGDTNRAPLISRDRRSAARSPFLGYFPARPRIMHYGLEGNRPGGRIIPRRRSRRLPGAEPEFLLVIPEHRRRDPSLPDQIRRPLRGRHS